MTTDPVYELLICTRAKIADPAHWTQHTEARDFARSPVSPVSALAVCWCAAGALVACAPDNDRSDPVFLDAYDRLRFTAQILIDETAGAIRGEMNIAALDTDELCAVNDVLGHAAALRMYDMAIERLQEEET